MIGLKVGEPILSVNGRDLEWVGEGKDHDDLHKMFCAVTRCGNFDIVFTRDRPCLRFRTATRCGILLLLFVSSHSQQPVLWVTWMC